MIIFAQSSLELCSRANCRFLHTCKQQQSHFYSLIWLLLRKWISSAQNCEACGSISVFIFIGAKSDLINNNIRGLKTSDNIQYSLSVTAFLRVCSQRESNKQDWSSKYIWDGNSYFKNNFRQKGQEANKVQTSILVTDADELSNCFRRQIQGNSSKHYHFKNSNGWETKKWKLG